MSASVSGPGSLDETTINLVATDTRIEGTVTVEAVSRVNGVLIGKVVAKDGSTLILSETSVVEGEILADTLFIDGYVQGKIHAKTRVVISRTGRVIGEVNTPSLVIEAGAFLEGKCKMEKKKA